jgi:lysozyme family protein
MAVSQKKIEDLSRMTRDQLRAISQNFREPKDVQEAARALITKISKSRLQAAVQSFETATPVFVEITKGLLEISELARANPVGDGVTIVTPLIRSFCDAFTEIGETEQEESMKALPGPGGGDPDGIEDEPLLIPESSQIAPPPGSVKPSRKFSEIADEYISIFDSAQLSNDRLALIDKLCTKIVSFRSTYESVGRPLNIPWYFIGVIHSLESNFNFATHLHNGDSLTHRTKRIPRGRPSAEVADPPFAWTTSAIDALRLKKFHTKSNWSLAFQLFRLEQYNGFGYRNRGLSTPYLWSFSDRYIKGKFIHDGVFDQNVVSKQCGGAVLIKRIISRGDIDNPH